MANYSKSTNLILHRFSKLSGIPVSELDPKIVLMLCGRHKDLVKASQQIRAGQEIELLLEKHGLTFNEFFDMLAKYEGAKNG